MSINWYDRSLKNRSWFILLFQGVKLKKSPAEMKQLKDAFDCIDLNGDGKLCAEELGLMMKNLGHGDMKAASLKALIASVDSNRASFVFACFNMYVSYAFFRFWRRWIRRILWFTQSHRAERAAGNRRDGLHVCGESLRWLCQLNKPVLSRCSTRMATTAWASPRSAGPCNRWDCS